MPAPRTNSEEMVVNLALSHLREGEVAILASDNTHRAREARKWFGIVRDATLRKKFWNFAKAATSPGALNFDAVGDLKKQYPLPEDCLMVRSVDDHSTDEWEVATAELTGPPKQIVKVLLTNSAAPVIRYTRRIVDVGLWDAEFVVAFAEGLAAKMAPAFGKTFNETSGRAAVAQDTLERAAKTDAREQAPQTGRTDTSWIAARRGYRYHSGRGW